MKPEKNLEDGKTYTEIGKLVRHYDANTARKDKADAAKKLTKRQFKNILLHIEHAANNDENKIVIHEELYSDNETQLKNRGFKILKRSRFYDQYPTITISW